jgi:hypothetical protein
LKEKGKLSEYGLEIEREKIDLRNVSEVKRGEMRNVGEVERVYIGWLKVRWRNLANACAPFCI